MSRAVQHIDPLLMHGILPVYCFFSGNLASSSTTLFSVDEILGRKLLFMSHQPFSGIPFKSVVFRNNFLAEKSHKYAAEVLVKCNGRIHTKFLVGCLPWNSMKCVLWALTLNSFCGCCNSCELLLAELPTQTARLNNHCCLWSSIQVSALTSITGNDRELYLMDKFWVCVCKYLVHRITFLQKHACVTCFCPRVQLVFPCSLTS